MLALLAPKVRSCLDIRLKRLIVVPTVVDPIEVIDQLLEGENGVVSRWIIVPIHLHVFPHIEEVQRRDGAFQLHNASPRRGKAAAA